MCPACSSAPKRSGDLGGATHSCGMLDEIDVNRRAGKDNAPGLPQTERQAARAVSSGSPYMH
jgi:hypothetical protein